MAHEWTRQLEGLSGQQCDLSASMSVTNLQPTPPNNLQTFMEQICADIKAEYENGRESTKQAVRQLWGRSLQQMAQLVRQPASVNRQTLSSLLHLACKTANPTAVNILLQAGAGPATIRSSSDLLVLAATAGRADPLMVAETVRVLTSHNPLLLCMPAELLSKVLVGALQQQNAALLRVLQDFAAIAAAVGLIDISDRGLVETAVSRFCALSSDLDSHVSKELEGHIFACWTQEIKALEMQLAALPNEQREIKYLLTCLAVQQKRRHGAVARQQCGRAVAPRNGFLRGLVLALSVIHAVKKEETTKAASHMQELASYTAKYNLALEGGHLRLQLSKLQRVSADQLSTFMAGMQDDVKRRIATLEAATVQTAAWQQQCVLLAQGSPELRVLWFHQLMM